MTTEMLRRILMSTDKIAKTASRNLLVSIFKEKDENKWGLEDIVIGSYCELLWAETHQKGIVIVDCVCASCYKISKSSCFL